MANLKENNIKITLEKLPLETDQGILESEQNKWGLPLKEVYKHGLIFYKGTFIKLIYLSFYSQKILATALFMTLL